MKRKKGIFYIVGCGALTAAMLSGCAEDESFSTSRSDVLSFSVDSVSLDTTFSNVPTPTASFWVYNRAGKGLRCSSVRLEKGNQTGFRVNVDGTYLGEAAGYQTQDVEVRKGDSIRVFIELTSRTQHQDTPRKVEDNLVFTLESGVQQKMNLYAYSWDALMMRNARISRDSLLQSSKPVVVYGGIRVDSLATLTVGAGTQLFFHEDAGMQVYGTLKVKGEAGKEVVMRGDRLDRMFPYLPYDRTPGQWQGIELMSSSYDNEISYADIHSAYSALKVDSGDVSRQKLLLQNSSVHNNQGWGVLIDSAKVQIHDCQLSNALLSPLFVHGGDVRGMIEMEKQGKQQYGAQASQNSRHDACHHSPIILLEQFHLLIQRNCQTDGGWSKQIADHISTGRIGLVINARKEQHADYQHDSDEKGILLNLDIFLFI